MIYHKSEIPADLQRYFVRAEIGLEPTLREFIANMVEVFDLCRELLADDGVLWLNLGDSYNAAGRTWHGTRQGFKQGTNRASAEKADNCRPSVETLKPKDLIGIPWRVAFALQAYGWYLRQDIIWHKPNPMPESVRDRCTKAHEYIFLLSKSERYFYDSEAMKEPSAGGHSKGNGARLAEQAIARTGGALSGGTAKSTLGTSAEETRNRRSVWTIPTESYSEAHFATFPQALVEPCILAGSRPGDIIFDPFLGSGTVAQVAQRLGRHWIGCELNPKYIDLQHGRARQRGLVLES